MSLLSRGTAGGFFPGFTITELYARGLSYFHWNYTVTLDGVVTLISILNAFVNVGGSFNCDIVFNNPGWHQVGGGNWQWDYSGPISSNPVVIQTFWLDQTRCLYAPYFPYADFWST